MKTTLREIIKLKPCSGGIKKLLKALKFDTTKKNWYRFYIGLTNNQKDKPIDFVFLLDVLGLESTIWCLSTQKAKITQFFNKQINDLYFKHTSKKLNRKSNFTMSPFLNVIQYYNTSQNLPCILDNTNIVFDDNNNDIKNILLYIMQKY